MLSRFDFQGHLAYTKAVAINQKEESDAETTMGSAAGPDSESVSYTHLGNTCAVKRSLRSGRTGFGKLRDRLKP